MIKKKLTLALATMLLGVGLLTIPVLAKDGEDGGDDTPSTSNTTQTTNSTTPRTESETEDSSMYQERGNRVEREKNATEIRSHRDALATETETEIKDLSKGRSKHSDTERQKNCQAAQQGLETKFQRLSANATRFQTKIDTALANAITYQKDNDLMVTNFAQLIADAQAAQSKAAASVSVLTSLNPTLDCTRSTVATNVANFKVATKQTRTELLASKDAVKAVLRALEAVKEEN